LLGVAVATTAVAVGAAGSPATAAGVARVNVVHGIPGVAVKVCVDGKTVVDHFRYGNTIVGATLPATTHKVRLVAAGRSCRSAAILHGAYTLAAARDYTIVANLNARGVPNLKAFVNNVKPTGVGKARLTITHTAKAPAVNVWVNKATLIGGKRFIWGKSRTVTVPAATYTVRVTLPGSPKAVIGPRHLTLTGVAPIRSTPSGHPATTGWRRSGPRSAHVDEGRAYAGRAVTQAARPAGVRA
jgi:hypothetical protein